MSTDATAAWLLMRHLVLDNDRRREACRQAGLSFSRVRALMAVDEMPRSMGEVADILVADSAFATVVVSDLERRGFVRREVDASDRRSRRALITPAGHRQAAAARAVLEAPPAALDRLTPNDLSRLRALLSSLAAPAHPSGSVLAGARATGAGAQAAGAGAQAAGAGAQAAGAGVSTPEPPHR